MNKTSKFVTITAAAMVALSGIALVPSYAQETGSIGAGSSVIVQRIDALENNQKEQFENISTGQYAAVQEKLSANPSLVSALKQQGVQLNNVVGIVEFANGNALAYLR